MARYARGKKSNAMSDISGFKVRYKDLKTTWNNLRVEPEEYDPKQPQLNPAKNIIDATALFKPRPDNDPDNVLFVVGFTQDWTIDPRLLPGIGMHGKGAVGNGAISEITISPNPSGDAGTGAIGSELLELSITEAGVAGTGAVGTASPVGVKGVSGTAGTGAVGVEALNLSIAEAGVAGTGAVGTESVQILGWGQEGWGINGWGE